MGGGEQGECGGGGSSFRHTLTLTTHTFLDQLLPSQRVDGGQFAHALTHGRCLYIERTIDLHELTHKAPPVRSSGLTLWTLYSLELKEQVLIHSFSGKLKVLELRIV